MAEKPGSEVLFLDEGLAISEGNVEEGQKAVLYGPEVGRGESNPRKEQDALLFQEGLAQTGPGTTAEVIISDSEGESTGIISLIQRDQDIADYVGYGSQGEASASGPISDEMLDVGTTSFLLYEDTRSEERYFGFFHDEYNEGTNHGGRIAWEISGLPDGTTTVIEDDPVDSDTEYYDLSPPDGEVSHQWGDPNTDGSAFGKDDEGEVNESPNTGFTEDELSETTVTFSVIEREVVRDRDLPSQIRFVGDDGTTVSRDYDGTNTEIEITF